MWVSQPADNLYQLLIQQMKSNTFEIPGWVLIVGTLIISVLILIALAFSAQQRVISNLSLPITITEYFDYQCIHCAKFAPTTVELRELHGDKVKFEYKAYPILGDMSLELAYGAEAARIQGKFLEYHDKTFELVNQVFDGTLESTEVTAVKVAEQITDLDLEKFATDMASDSVKKLVSDSKAAGSKLGVTSTPTVFIAGQVVQVGKTNASTGETDYTEFKDTVARLIKEAEAKSTN